MTVRSCLNAKDFETAAKRRLPRPLFDYIDGGADDEITKRANVSAFDRYQLVPNYLRDVRQLDMRRTVLGCPLEWPLILSPTGMTRMFHPDGEQGVAIEAAKAGVAYCLSTMGSESIEKIASACSGPKIYQLYLLNDDGLNVAAIDRAKAAGFDALCLTVDTITPGNRERDRRSGLTIPPRLSLNSLMAFARRPGWCIDYALGGRFSLPNIAPLHEAPTDISTLAAFFASKVERNIGWRRVQRIAARWDGPFAIKGIQAVDDALLASDHGATAVIISNHGGRQLDGCAAPIDLVADIVDAVGNGIEVILDGGVRRGTHIAKALAMGARACMTGRPYLYALAAYGRPGVARMLALLREEVERTMTLLGCASIDSLNRSHLRRADQLPAFLATGEPIFQTPQLHWSK